MQKGLFVMLVAACLLTPPALGHAQEPPAAKPAPGTAAAPATPAPLDPADAARVSAAESRYRAWVEQEHAKDAAAFQQERSKIEDKYKGYVRPKHEKKGNKPQPAPEAKTN